jgi:hypothetical protein
MPGALPLRTIPQLPSHILTHGIENKYSRRQLEEIGKKILKQKR